LKAVVGLASKRNKYIGPSSCYARNEGAYVVKEPNGVSYGELGGVLALIIRDMLRGYSYGDRCEEVDFDESYAEQRARYLAALYSAGRPVPLRKMAVELAKRAITERRVPRELRVRLAGPRAAELARELIRKRIVSPDQVEIVEEGGRRRPLAVPVRG
jgi:hypothetical protein